MTSPFSTVSALACSPFESPNSPTAAILVFYRKTLEQNSAGELIQTWASAFAVRGELVPEGGKLVRYLHGELQEVPFSFAIRGIVDIRATDRTEIPQYFASAVLVEVVNVNYFGNQQTEAWLQWVR